MTVHVNRLKCMHLHVHVRIKHGNKLALHVSRTLLLHVITVCFREQACRLAVVQAALNMSLSESNSRGV